MSDLPPPKKIKSPPTHTTAMFRDNILEIFLSIDALLNGKKTSCA